MPEFTIDCTYCVGTPTLLSASLASEQDPTAWGENWKATLTAGPGGGPQVRGVECPECGAEFGMEDDGIPADQGGTIQQTNISRPTLASLNAVTGPRTGGNALVITGSRLELGTLIVRFDGKPALTVDQRTLTTARVVVPQGCYRLNVEEHLHVLTLTITSGALIVNEAVTTDGGSVGVIRHIDGSTYKVIFQTLVETPAAMVGTRLVGGGTGGTADIDEADLPVFTDGEQVFGLSSGAYGSARGGTLLIVDNPTTSYSSDELVQGESSGAMVRLTGNSPYSGLVDVSVENEHGQRVVNGTLIGAYTYA